MEDDSESESGEPIEQDDAGLSSQIYTILELLRDVPSYKPVTFDFIMQETSLDLEVQAELRQALTENDKVTIKNNTIAYCPEFQFNTLEGFVNTLENTESLRGMTSSEVLEACQDEEVAEDIVQKATLAGLVITLKSGRSKTEKVFFPRGKRFLVELAGTFTIVPNRDVFLCEDTEHEQEISRGDCVYLTKDFLQSVKNNKMIRACALSRRVSLCSDGSLVKDNTQAAQEQHLMENISNNATPYSISSTEPSTLEEEHKETSFTFNLNSRKLPVDPLISILKVPKETSVKLYKAGCTNDIRNLWRQVSAKTCFKAEERTKLVKEMLNEGLITEEEIKLKNKEAILQSRKKRKRRRVNRRPIKISNTHMV